MNLPGKALPPLQCLRAVLAVAEAGSFTRAAETLALTQTAVSHQIAQIEDWLGTALFLRERRAIRLTPTGEALLPILSRHIDGLEQGLNALRRREQRQRLVISTMPEFGSQWLGPRLDRFVALHPDITLALTLEYRRADLASGEADIAIWLGQGDPRLKSERLGLEEEFIVCSPELAARLPERQAFRVAPFLHHDGERLTVLDWHRFFSQIYGTAAIAGAPGLREALDLDNGPRFANFADMIAACRRGEGFALVRSALVSHDLANGTLVRSISESLPSDLHYHLVTAPRRIGDPAVAAFTGWIRGEWKASPS